MRDGALLQIPEARYKTAAKHEVPLVPAASEIFEAAPKFFPGAFVFSTTGGTRPVSGFSKMKSRLDQAIDTAREAGGSQPMPGWTIHDLRRTARTRLTSDLGVDTTTAELILGHRQPGLHQVYDLGLHRGQRRAALEKWAEALQRIVGTPAPDAGNVILLSERRHT